MSKRFDPAATTVASHNADEQLAEILDGYLCSLEHDGAPPDVDALAAAHPELADEIRTHVESLHLLHQIGRGDQPSSSTRLPPAAKRLGDFELVRQIGRGGMGIVYEARQLSLNRPVALKVLPFAAILDEQHITRFKIEAQAAAQLHHPNIVPVYAVGQERGVHFFAMQLIEGQSLEAAIEQMRKSRRPANGDAPIFKDDTLPEGGFSTAISTNSRRYCQSVARLGVQAAAALHHAHEFGVVHRDVKPSNLLIDRSGVLWVTDFGLARIQAGSTCLTAPGHVVGTARYMSPEQASGQQALVDAASDVYSLGATLYELLTLEHCHRGEDRQELQTAIVDHDPPPPRRINRAVPLELETIVLHALEKSRTDRYATARELADDLQRFLDGKPIAAHRPTLVDRAARWALRRRRSVAAATAMLCIVAATLAIAALRIAAEKQRTVVQQQHTTAALEAAQEHFAQARLVVDRFNDDVADQLAEFPGASPLRRALLNDALQYYEQFMQHAADDPTLRYDVASAAFQAGAAAEQLGDYRQAEALYHRADRLFGKLASDQPGDQRLSSHRAKCLNKLGLLRAASGDLGVARDCYEQAIETLSGADSRDALAETHANLGLLEHRLGNAAAAVERLEEASRLLGLPVADETADRKRRHKLAIISNNLSYVLHRIDVPRSVVVNEQARDLLTRLLEDAPQSLEYRSDLAASWTNYGAICGREEDWAGAAAAHGQAVELTRQLLRQSPGIVRHRRDLAVSLSNAGEAHCRNNADEAARASLIEAVTVSRRLVDDFPSTPGLQDLLAGVLNNYASALETAGQLHEALDAYAEAVDVQQRIVAAAPARADQQRLSTQYFNYSRALRSAGKAGEADRVLKLRNNLIAQLQTHHAPSDTPHVHAQAGSKP